MKHGASAYRSRRACRCEVCTEDHLARLRREKSERIGRLRADPTLAPHGRVSTYNNWGCRCADCVAAQSVENAKHYWARRGGV